MSSAPTMLARGRDRVRRVLADTLGARLEAWLLPAAWPEPINADCILVPGALVHVDGTASDLLRARVGNAVDLWRRGLSARILMSGAGRRRGRRPEAEVARDLALAAGVPAAAVLIEARSRTTRENLRFGRDLMAAHGLASCLISTDAFHMTRCLVIARDLGLAAHPAPALASPAWTDPVRRRWLLLHESTSMLRYALDGWVGRRAGPRDRSP